MNSARAIAHVIGGVRERGHQPLLHVLGEAARRADLGHREAHAGEPLVAHVDADRIRQVARAQARVAGVVAASGFELFVSEACGFLTVEQAVTTRGIKNS